MLKKVKKIIQKVFVLSLIFDICFSSIFSFPIFVEAEETHIGKISGENVRFRSKPTTDKDASGAHNIMFELEEGSSVTVLSMNKITGTGCSDGWYNVSYGEFIGYVCSSYITIDGYDIYDRPWTSPKKAIVGGAKFIGKSYISKGQFTSYLKKFNVNPKGYYDVYNHLYMSNIAAPSSEALSSYKAYKENGLFELPLEFNIPIYRHMDDDGYDRPGGNLTEIETQDEITDKDFEELLEKEEFPESYRGALRYLHTKHPTWTFKGMYTDIRFSTAVTNFQNVSAIQGSDKYYYLENGKKVQAGNDKGWYLPNKETLSYYLDPRNFLTEKYILQFESLEYSENYTEKVVASVLKGTFMEGISVLDNQSYASIFIEAGKNADKETGVSSVYLASLAKQEVGTKGSISTSGEKFEYDGETYQGLYNFYNIGAKSSAESPVHAGLVYASGGVCTICSSTESYEKAEIPKETIEDIIEEASYQIKDEEFIYDFSLGEKISKIEEKFEGYDIEIKSDRSRICTGDKIKINGETYYAVIYGDVTGDGEINSADLLKIRQYLLGMTSLKGAYKEAAKVASSSVNSSDLLKVRQYLLGMTRIKQG